jgi:hypothetical protein
MPPNGDAIDILQDDDVSRLGVFTYPSWGKPAVVGAHGHHAECLPFIQPPFELFADHLVQPGGDGNMQDTSYSKETGKVAINKERWLDNRIYAWYSSNNPAHRISCVKAVCIEAKCFLEGWSGAHTSLVQAKMEHLHRANLAGLVDLSDPSCECPVRLNRN